MKKIYLTLALILCCAFGIHAQKVIPLYNGAAPGSENWNWDEARQDSNIFHTPIVYNVSRPTLTVYLPDSTAPKTNTAVVIAPGGGFHLLSINSEGVDVARWLNKKGIACFVLKYRLLHSKTNDPIQEMMDMISKGDENDEETRTAILMAIADGAKRSVMYANMQQNIILIPVK